MEWKCDIVCFQETSLNSSIVQRLWGCPFLDCAVLDAVHTGESCWFGIRELWVQVPAISDFLVGSTPQPGMDQMEGVNGVIT